jgi:hypothetical protein
VIQVSPTTHFPRAAAGHPKASQTAKKEGLFAKIFAGLLRNIKNSPDQFNNAAAEIPESGAGEKLSLVSKDEKTGKKVKPGGKAETASYGQPRAPETGKRGETKKSPADIFFAAPIGPPAGTPAGPPAASKTPHPGDGAAGGALAGAETAGEDVPLAGPEAPETPELSWEEPGRENPVQKGPGQENPAESLAFRFVPPEPSKPAEQGSDPGALKKDKAEAAESRPGKKNRERLTLEVRDLRQDQGLAGKDQEVTVTRELRSAGETELVVEIHSGGRSPADPGESRAFPAGPSQAFEDLLARELNQNLNGDIVRQAQIILKDGGEGTIRLSLKPASLGNVKIHLEMAENKIAGHIIVESNEALRAFEREIHSLEQAFKDSGFEGAALEMAVASGNGRDGGNRQWKEAEASPFFSERFAARLAASQYDAAGDSPVLSGFSGAVRQINMLV